MQTIPMRLLSALVYPRTLDDVVELVAPLRSTREVRAVVVDVSRETRDASTLVLRASARLAAHRAGQHVLLTAEIDGVRRTRCFSIASAEGRERGTIAITVKARTGGLVTPRLVSGELRGAVVALSQPMGAFVLPDDVPPRLLLVSGGSGITPVMSMLRTLIRRGHRGEVAFLHWARTEDDVIFRDELARIAREAPPELRVRVRTSLFSRAALAEDVADFEQWDTWACGPQPFLDVVTGAFADRGAAERVRVERFSLPATLPCESQDAGVVSFVRSGRRASGCGSLLVMAEEAGLTPASGCRIGICHSCKRRKLSGTTRDLRTGELSTDADVDVQLCVSAPVGPVAIDL